MEQLDKNLIISKRIVFLDYLRIFAFISVLLGHKFYDILVSFSNNFDIHETPRIAIRFILPLIQGGGAGVVIFFLISGYIITHVLRTEKTTEFLIKRIFRIYPLYIIAVLIQYSPLFFTNKMPDLPHLLAQLSLMGDFFGTSYTLKGVEWTLRAEILFYFYMAVLRSFNAFEKYKAFIPYFYIFTIAFCSFFAPIPSEDFWAKGYLTIYWPFLLLGSIFYLAEKKDITRTMLLIFSCIVFFHYFRLIGEYHKIWLTANFAILAFFIFYFANVFQKQFVLTPWAKFLSDMTFAVYLFHNWAFEYIKDILSYLKLDYFYPNLLGLIVLFGFCYLMVVSVERPGIRLGRRVLNFIFKDRKSAH